VLEQRALRLREEQGRDFGQLVPAPTHVFLTACGRALALDLTLVRAVLPAAPATRLPGQGGLIGYEREVFWLDSLVRLAGLGPAAAEPSHVILLRSLRMGFWVESLDGMEMLVDPVTRSVLPALQGTHLAVRRSLENARLLLDEL